MVSGEVVGLVTQELGELSKSVVPSFKASLTEGLELDDLDLDGARGVCREPYEKSEI